MAPSGQSRTQLKQAMQDSPNSGRGLQVIVSTGHSSAQVPHSVHASPPVRLVHIPPAASGSRRALDLPIPMPSSLEMMEDLGVPWATRHLMHWGVRGFGRSTWEESRQSREGGMPRIIPAEARPIGPEETWGRYREYLETVDRHSAQIPVISKGFCSYPKMANNGAS